MLLELLEVELQSSSSQLLLQLFDDLLLLVLLELLEEDHQSSSSLSQLFHVHDLDHVLSHSSRWSCEGLAESSDSSLILLRSNADLDSLSIDSATEAKRVIIIAMKVKMESFMFRLIYKVRVLVFDECLDDEICRLLAMRWSGVWFVGTMIVWRMARVSLQSNSACTNRCHRAKMEFYWWEPPRRSWSASKISAIPDISYKK